MECIYCGEKDEGQLILCTRVINGNIKHVDVCLGCMWHEKAIWESRVENGRREILSEQKEHSARAIPDNNERQARIQPRD